MFEKFLCFSLPILLFWIAWWNNVCSDQAVTGELLLDKASDFLFLIIVFQAVFMTDCLTY